MNSKIIKLCPSTYDFEVNNFSHTKIQEMMSLLVTLSKFYLCFYWLWLKSDLLDPHKAPKMNLSNITQMV